MLEDDEILISVQELYRPVVFDKDAPLDFTKAEFDRAEEDDVDKVKWWTTELSRLKHGFTAKNGVWLNPFYYFFINYIKADIFNPEEEKSEIGTPYYLKFQHELADMIWFSKYEVLELKEKIEKARTARQKRRLIKNAQNIILAKARRKGLTTLVCAYLIWLLIFGDSVFGTYLRMGYGYPDDDTYNKFRAMFDLMIVSLPDMIKPNLVYPDNEVEVGNSYVNEKGETVTTNRIYWANFGKKDGKFRGGKLFFVFFDEAGKFTNWSRVKGASKDCFYIGQRQVGYYLLGGTSDAISNKGYQDYKDDYDKPHLSNARKFFITAEEGTHPFVNYRTGESYKEQAREFFNENRRALKEGGDILAYNIYRQENPLHESELFILSGGSIFDNDALDEQIIWNSEIGKNKDILVGDLEFEKNYLGKDTNKVIFIENPNGNWRIYRNGLPNPDKPNLFLSAIDDVYQNIAPHSDSKPAMMIFKDWDITEEESDLPVAIYLNKEKDRRKRHEDFLKGLIFWNAKTLFENNDDSFVNFCKLRNMVHFIQMTTNNNFGYSGHAWHGKFKNQAEELAIKYIDNKRHQRCYFNEALQALKDWGTKNTDIGICYMACLLYQDMRKTLSKVENLEKSHQEPAIVLSQLKKPASIPKVFSRFSRR